MQRDGDGGLVAFPVLRLLVGVDVDDNGGSVEVVEMVRPRTFFFPVSLKRVILVLFLPPPEST